MDKFDPTKHHRHSIRLKDYDYSQPGAYFVTIVVDQRLPLLGEIDNGEVKLSPYGKFVTKAWQELLIHYPKTILDEFCVMPNHVHGIIIIKESGGRGIQFIVRSFKSFSARQINAIRRTPGVSFWQRNYYKHIIRNEAELLQIRQYIINNPAQWEQDTENPNLPRTPILY